MKARFSVMASAALLLSTLAFARGGWHSGGGMLSSVAENPWFLQKSTPKAEYCIDIDTDNFGAPESVVRNALQRALGHWQRELAQQQSPVIQTGAQQFVEVACSPEVDVRFQFGVLDEAQQKQFDNPKVFIAAAVLTSYNREILRGRGFVYVSPEHGPLSLERENVVPNRWTLGNGRLLELALVHELGHVFGATHNREGFMNAKFLETFVVSPNMAPRMANTSVTPSITGMAAQGGTLTSCRYWSQSGKPICRKVDYEYYGAEFVISEGDSWDGPFRPILKAEGGNQIHRMETFSSIWLPKEQTVFPQYSGKEQSEMGMSAYPKSRTFGTITDMKNKKLGKHVFTIDPDGITIEISEFTNQKCMPPLDCLVGMTRQFEASHFNYRND